MSIPVAQATTGPIVNPKNPAGHQKVRPFPGGSSGGSSSPVPLASALKGGTTGVAYSETISAQGGTTPYTFAVTSGALPTSTSLNTATGVISGTPTVAATASFTITVTDTNGFTGSQAFAITISAPSAGGGSYTFVA